MSGRSTDDGVAGEQPPVHNETLELIGTARAIRRFRTDTVDESVIRTVVWAGTRASSPNNTQLWHFVVVRDAERRRSIADALQHFTKWIDRLPAAASPSEERVRVGARDLLTGLAKVPVLVFVCIEDSYPERQPDPRYLWSTAGTCAQNMIVAARSLGLGATLTMLHVANESGVRELLGVPLGVEVGAMITLGWPADRHGPLRRSPIDSVIHDERW